MALTRNEDWQYNPERSVHYGLEILAGCGCICALWGLVSYSYILQGVLGCSATSSGTRMFQALQMVWKTAQTLIIQTPVSQDMKAPAWSSLEEFRITIFCKNVSSLPVNAPLLWGMSLGHHPNICLLRAKGAPRHRYHNSAIKRPKQNIKADSNFFA